MARPSGRSQTDFSDIRTNSHSVVTQDAFSWMSAERMSLKKDDMDSLVSCHEGVGLPPSYPLPLVFFVCILSIIGGLVVTGVHYAILFSGCPLGLNGCNDFTPDKEKYGFFLIRAFGDHIPEDLIYIICAAIGGLILAQMCVRLPDHLAFQITGGGTVQGLVAVASGQRISLTAAGLRIISSCVYLGTGGTLGMDGPAIQVCTAVTTFCGWALGMRGVQTQSLLASLGFAAGFAASFNAPLAGVMFAMEELAHASPNLSRHIICIILMVSIVATGVARLYSGNKELLQTQWGADLLRDVEGGSLDNVFGVRMWMLISIPIAVVCSLFGHLASIALRKFRTWVLHLQDKVGVTVPMVLALTISASIGSAVFRATNLRGVWGIGYESLQKIFDQEHSIASYFIFAAGKLLATAVSVSVRAPGDLLEPALIGGAFLGGGMGRAFQAVLGDDLEERIMQPCLVFGMVALFASCFRFPLTPVIIVLEVTGVDTYALVLPAALAAFTAVTISNRLYVPFLDSIMYEDGISLHDLSEDAAHVEEGTGEEEDHEPEPEETSSADGPSCTPSQAPSVSEHSVAPSVMSHSSHASARFRTVLHGMENSMLALSGQPRSRSSSRTNSRTNSHASGRSPRGESGRSPRGEFKMSSLVAALSPSRNPSRNPSSDANSIGGFSLNVPASECSQSRAKRHLRLNTGASGASSCASSNFHSEMSAVPNAISIVPLETNGTGSHDAHSIVMGMAGSSTDVRADCPHRKLHASLQDRLGMQSVKEVPAQTQKGALGIRQAQYRPVPEVRAELECMRIGVLFRYAIAVGVDADKMDTAIEQSPKAVIDLVLEKMFGACEQPESEVALETQSPQHSASAGEFSFCPDKESKQDQSPSEKLHGQISRALEDSIISPKEEQSRQQESPQNFCIATPQDSLVGQVTKIQIGNDVANVTAVDEVPNIQGALESRPFKEWTNAIATNGQMKVSDIHVQSFDMLGSKLTSLHFNADAKLRGKSLPASVSMRGGAVAILVVLHHDDRESTIIVRRPRVPVCHGSIAEIPSRTFDYEGNYAGVATALLKDEIGMETKESNLIDMTALAYKDTYSGVFPVADSSDEFVRIFLYRRNVSADELGKIVGAFKNTTQEGDMLTAQVLPVASLWKVSPDAKTLAALALYSRLTTSGLVPKYCGEATRYSGALCEVGV